MKLISFLVPVYNLETWMLKRCIDSLLLQDIAQEEFEIVVIDDGSDISVEPILEAYPNAPIRFHRQPNSGLGAARNKALSLAKGEYCLFVDADDYLLAGSIAPLCDCLRSEKPDILQLAYRNCTDKEPIRVTFPSLQFKKFDSGSEYMMANHLTGGNWLLFRREPVERRGLRYPEKLLHEDEEFITRLFLFAETVTVCNQPVYAYYYRPESIVNHASPQQETRRLNDFLYVASSLKAFAKNEPLSVAQHEALQRKIDFMGVDFLLKTLRTATPEEYLNHYMPQLKAMALYPPAPRNEGLKYQSFRLLVQTRTGRRVLQLLDRHRSKKF